MSTNPFKHFLVPQSTIAVDATSLRRFDELSDAYSDLEVFIWSSKKSDTANFETLVQSAIESARNKVLMGGSSDDQSCLVIALLALGRGFDVFLCGDLIDGPKDERALLIDRLRQHGVAIVSKKQIIAEFSAALSHTTSP